MKRTLCLILLLSCLAGYANNGAKKGPQHEKTEGMRTVPKNEKNPEHSFFDLDVSLCDDEELLHYNIEIPEQSALRQLMTKFGCAILAKYYAAQELVQGGYDKTKRVLLRLKNYYFPTTQPVRSPNKGQRSPRS